MKRIGVISDTHSYIDDKIKTFFNDVDIIFHAGDIGSVKVIEELRKIANTYFVYGNIDNSMIRNICNETVIENIEGQKILMKHIGGYPNRYYSDFYKLIIKEEPQIVITGHSHILKIIYDKKLNHLHINPGAYGNNGFHKVRTAVKFIIENEKIRDMEIYEIDRKSL